MVSGYDLGGGSAVWCGDSVVVVAGCRFGQNEINGGGVGGKSNLLLKILSFNIACLLGYGAFGNVYRGTFETEGALAIKELLPSSRTTIEEFHHEIVLISNVKHENLVRLVGFCEPGSKGRKLLIYEYVCNGSLPDYIMGKEGKSLTWRQRVTIAIGSAKVPRQKYCEYVTKTIRRKTRTVMVGNVGIRSDHPIRIQTMTTSNTKDVNGTVAEVMRIADKGADSD